MEDDLVDWLAALARHALANDGLVDHVVADFELDCRILVGAGDPEIVTGQRQVDDLGVIDRNDCSVGAVTQRKHRVASDDREGPIAIDRDAAPGVATVEGINPHPVANELPRT